MKLGKFVLGTAAMGLTVASGFAFKMHKKFNLTQLYTIANPSTSCRLSNPACYTLSSGTQRNRCAAVTYYTNSNATNCVNGNNSTWATHASRGRSLITTS
jgi:hypothetical protein